MKLEEGRTLSRRKLLKRVAWGAVGLAGVDAFLVEPNWIDYQEVAVPVKGLGKSFEGYRVGQISDIHWPQMIDQGFLDRAMGLLMAGKPDVVCVTGDIFESKVVSLAGVFDRLDEAPDGVLAVRGNHDFEDPAAALPEIERSTPFRMVENEHVMIERGGDRLAVGGVGDLWMGKVDLESAFYGVGADVPRLLLSHNPDVAEESSGKVRVDLQMSGHTHGGQIATPFHWAPISNSKYGMKFLAGMAEGKAHRVYTNRGLARWGIHARFFSRPEVTVFVLESA